MDRQVSMIVRGVAGLILAVPLLGADVTGGWAATLKSNGRESRLHLELRQAGEEITGAFGFRSDFLWPLIGGRVEGDKLRLIFRMQGMPEATFEGTLTGGDSAAGKLLSPVAAMRADVELRRTGALTALPATLTVRNAPGLEKLSDEFSRPESLKEWSTLSAAEGWPDRIDQIDVGKTGPGYLSIVPNSGAWWAGYHGVYFFKTIPGDFVVTARLKVTGKTGGEPANVWTISGLLVRAAGDTKIARDKRKENWLYLMTGRGPAEGRVLDAKSTVDGNNAWDVTPTESGWHELRIARVGPLFGLFCRPDGADWKVRKWIVREDLPESVQVGVNVTSDFKLSASMPSEKYNAEVWADKSNIDAATLVDWIRFTAVPKEASALAGKRLIDLTEEEISRLAPRDSPR